MTPKLGVCYYPEHWPEDQWANDAAQMRELGLSWVRIGEFAWRAAQGLKLLWERRPLRLRAG